MVGHNLHINYERNLPNWFNLVASTSTKEDERKKSFLKSATKCVLACKAGGGCCQTEVVTILRSYVRVTNNDQLMAGCLKYFLLS